MTDYKLVPVVPTEFSKGDTDPRGDCGMFVAGINHNPSSSPRDQWGHRIEVYGDTPEHAEELRDRVLRALAAPDVHGEPVAYIHDNDVYFEGVGGDVNDHIRSYGQPLYAFPQPAPDVTQLVEALEQVIRAAPSGGPLWHGSEQIVEARAALAAHRKGGEA